MSTGDAAHASRRTPGELRFGAQLWSQATDWAGFRDAALAAEAAGWDGIWTWDHLLAIQGPWEQPIFEGWTALAAVAAITRRVTVGLLVGANTFRAPGHTAKLATTLDRISEGRAVLGIGGAWFEREHDAFDIEFFSGFGARLDRLDESVAILRRLLDGERFSFEGQHYTLRDALCEPRPVQAHLPILVGGSGPKKTLRTVALRADAWNTSGSVEDVTRNLAILAEHCAAVGRDLADIELTVSFPIVIRDTEEAARTRIQELCRHNGIAEIGGVPNLAGPPLAVAQALRPYRELGFRHIMVRMPAPYDPETIARLPELRAALADTPVEA